MIPILSGQDLWAIAKVLDDASKDYGVPLKCDPFMFQAVAMGLKLAAPSFQNDPRPRFEIVIEREDER